MDNKISIDPEEEPELYERLCHASRILEEVMGPGASRFVTEVEWSQLTDSGPLGPRKVIRLKMTDPVGGVKETLFQPVELRSPGYMKTRLREVWSEFLRQLFDERMERVDELMTTLERD
jgi:hypothetical protein